MRFNFVTVEGLQMNLTIVGGLNAGVCRQGDGHIENGASIEVAVGTNIGATAGETDAEGGFTAVYHALGVLGQR